MIKFVIHMQICKEEKNYHEQINQNFDDTATVSYTLVT